MNQDDRDYMDAVKSTVREAIKMTEHKIHDSENLEEEAYFTGLVEGYQHVYEIIRRIK
mgnify:CR=1 FL=1|tara:strand:- start:127 stop:300 length:174 start_codon:yes stop_codon:yes gene_type:complete